MRETKDGIGFYVKGGFDGRREDEGREERRVGAGGWGYNEIGTYDQGL